jgi:hypothetical protein
MNANNQGIAFDSEPVSHLEFDDFPVQAKTGFCFIRVHSRLKRTEFGFFG